MALQINELLALQALDTEIGRLEQERGGLDQGERIERALAVRQSRLDNAERRLKALEMEQRSTELELKSLEEKKHEESQKLYSGKISAPRELQALELEIASLERQRLRLDDTILKRGDELETARKSVEAARATVDEAEKALRIVRRRYEKASERIDQEMAKLTPEREKLAKALAPDILRRYNDLRHRNHNVGAVRVQNGACGGCRMKIGTALLRRVHNSEAYTYCESCNRFLFPAAEE